MMVLAQHPGLPISFEGLLFLLYIGVGIPLTFVTSLFALSGVFDGGRKTSSTRFFAFGSLLVGTPAALRVFWLLLHSGPMEAFPFGILWGIMAAISLFCSVVASVAVAKSSV